MREIKLNGYTLEMYEDVLNEMPIKRFQLYNHFVMVEAGVGSTIQDFDAHVSAILRDNKDGRKNNVEQRVMNLRQCYHMLLQGVSPKHKAFVVMIKKINGVPLNDLSDSNIEEVLTKLSRKGLTQGLVDKFIDFIKKKLKRKLRSFSMN